MAKLDVIEGIAQLMTKTLQLNLKKIQLKQLKKLSESIYLMSKSAK